MDVRFIGIYLISFNLLWFFMSLPIITLPSATGALYVVTRDMVHRRSVNWRDFFAAMKAHWFTSWRWGFVNLAAALRQEPPPLLKQLRSCPNTREHRLRPFFPQDASPPETARP